MESDKEREDKEEFNRKCHVGQLAYLVQHEKEMIQLCAEDEYFAAARREQLEAYRDVIVPRYGLDEYKSEVERLLDLVLAAGVKSGAWRESEKRVQ